MLKKRTESLSSDESSGFIETDLSEKISLENRSISINQARSLRDNRTIFVKLREGKVHFVSTTRNLYFVDSLDFPVSEMIKNVFKGMKQTPDINQCYLDQHSFFKGAFCIQLSQTQHDAVLVALRLQGIVIKITKTAISGGV